MGEFAPQQRPRLFLRRIFSSLSCLFTKTFSWQKSLESLQKPRFRSGSLCSFSARLSCSPDPGTEGIPDMITTAVLNFSDNKTFLLLGILLLILVGGCFMEGVSLMIILLPVFLPIVNKIGVDLVHFGIFLTLGITLGVMTPPFGMCLFVISSLTGESIGVITRELVPFLVVLVIVLLMVTFLPGISLFLPRLLGV